MGYLVREPIDLREWHGLAIDRRDGASVEFLGIVRGEENGQTISYLEYEAYEPMAERLIAQLVEQAKTRWSLHRVYVCHRIGRVRVGEIAVLIGVQVPHRDQAFEACRFLIDAIKRDVPIWKTAFASDGAVLQLAHAHGNPTD